MNAPTALAPPPAARIMDVHRFRGEYLDRFGAIETWVVERLLDARADDIPPMLGPRIAGLREALTRTPQIVKDRSKVQGLLDELAPYQALRSVVAHAVAHRMQDCDGRPVYIFQPPATAPNGGWQCRSVLRSSEFRTVLGRLSGIANELSQQTPDAKPSSPPRPTPA